MDKINVRKKEWIQYDVSEEKYRNRLESLTQETILVREYDSRNDYS